VLELHGAGQDHVGVAGGLVQIDVHRDHEVELVEGVGEPLAVRCREHWVSADRDKAAHARVARLGLLDLLGHQAAGNLATDGGDLPGRGRVGSHLEGLRRATGLVGALGGAREHHAAFSVEPAREHVDHVDEPARERAELLGAEADAPVPGPPGGDELRDEPAGDMGVDAGGRRDRLRRVVPADLLDLLDAVGEVGQAAQLHQTLGEEHIADREQEVGVCPGLDEDVFRGDLRGLGAARVDDHHLAALVLNGLQALLRVGGRHQAALGRQRVAPHADEVLGAVEVGDREVPGISDHPVERDVLGELVHGRGREAALGLQSAEQGRDVELAADVMPGGIADVVTVGVGAVGLADRAETIDAVGQGFFPLELFPAAVFAFADRLAQTLGILVDLLHRVGLGAEVAATSGVVFVTLDANDLLALAVDFAFEATRGLTGGAGAIDDLGGHGFLGQEVRGILPRAHATRGEETGGRGPRAG
jgi:hypothetical protein